MTKMFALKYVNWSGIRRLFTTDFPEFPQLSRDRQTQTFCFLFECMMPFLRRMCSVPEEVSLLQLLRLHRKMLIAQSTNAPLWAMGKNSLPLNPVYSIKRQREVCNQMDLTDYYYLMMFVVVVVQFNCTCNWRKYFRLEHSRQFFCRDSRFSFTLNSRESLNAGDFPMQATVLINRSSESMPNDVIKKTTF